MVSSVKILLDLIIDSLDSILEENIFELNDSPL